MADAEDREIAARFREWIDLPADASPEQMWSAREAYAATMEHLLATPDAAAFIGTLLGCAINAHELELVCETVIDVTRDHPELSGEVYLRSADEPWVTLSSWLFDPGAAPDTSGANVAQIAVAYSWMGGKWPGESAEGEYLGRFNSAAFNSLHALHTERGIDPVPLLSALVRVCRTEGDIGYFAAGPFEDVIRQAPQHRAAIEVAARRDPEWVDVLHGVWVDQKTTTELSDFLRAQVIVLEN